MATNNTLYHPPTYRTIAAALQTPAAKRFLVSPTVYATRRSREYREGPGWYVTAVDGRNNLWLTAPPESTWTSTMVLACLREMRTFYGPHTRESVSIVVEPQKCGIGDGWHVHYTVEEPGGARRLTLYVGDTRVGHEAEHLPESMVVWFAHLQGQGPLALSECGTRLMPILRATAAA